MLLRHLPGRTVQREKNANRAAVLNKVFILVWMAQCTVCWSEIYIFPSGFFSLCAWTKKFSRSGSLFLMPRHELTLLLLWKNPLLAIMFHTLFHTCLLIHLFPLFLGSNILVSPHSVGSPSNLLLGRDEWLGRYCITLPVSCLVCLRFWLAPP